MLRGLFDNLCVGKAVVDQLPLYCLAGVIGHDAAFLNADNLGNGVPLCSPLAALLTERAAVLGKTKRFSALLFVRILHSISARVW